MPNYIVVVTNPAAPTKSPQAFLVQYDLRSELAKDLREEGFITKKLDVFELEIDPTLENPRFLKGLPLTRLLGFHIDYPLTRLLSEIGVKLSKSPNPQGDFLLLETELQRLKEMYAISHG